MNRHANSAVRLALTFTLNKAVSFVDILRLYMNEKPIDPADMQKGKFPGCRSAAEDFSKDFSDLFLDLG